MEELRNGARGLLREAERRTRMDLTYIAKGGIWMTVATVIGSGISVAMALAFANFLTKEAYGTYQYVLAVAEILGLFALGGIDTAVTRASARGKDGTLMHALRAKIRWGLIGSAGSLVVSAWYFLHGNALLGWSFAVVAVAIPLWEAAGLYVSYLQGRRRFDLLSIYDVATQIAAAVVVIPCIFFTDSVVLLLALYFAVWGVTRFLFLRLSLRQEPPSAAEDPNLIRYGKHVTVMNAMSTIAASADKFILWHLLGPASLATYIFAQTIPLRAVGVLKMANRLAFPKMAVRDEGLLRRTLPRAVFLLVLVSVVAAAAYAFLVPFVFELLLPQYVEAVPYAQALALLVALQPFSLFGIALSAKARTRSLYVFNTLVPFVRVVLFASCIPMWGLAGGIAALVAGKAFESLLQAALFYRLSPTSSTP